VVTLGSRFRAARYISAGFWRTQLGAADDVIGRRIHLEGKAAHFRFPNSERDLWRAIDLNGPSGEMTRLSAIAKLKPGMPRSEAVRLAQMAARDLDPGLVADPAAVAFAPVTGARPFDDYTVNATRLLFTGVVLVLFVACVNVANLLLARAIGRRRERAVRAALGASRFRLVQQALLESLVMVTLAATRGLLLSWMAVSALDTVLFTFITRRGPNAIDFDARSAISVVALAVLATLSSGVLPAWLGTRTTASDVLREGERGSSEGRAARRLTAARLNASIWRSQLITGSPGRPTHGQTVLRALLEGRSRPACRTVTGCRGKRRPRVCWPRLSTKLASQRGSNTTGV
jgi:putative ABC transport system permease protein